MLVLTRKINETIIIDDCITVTVISIQGQNVRLGIKAPEDIRVNREEIHRRLQQFANDEPSTLVAATPRK